MTQLEICLEDVAGAILAEEAGADRVEVCSALSEGGVTPSIGAVRRVLASTSRIGVQVLIRPRGGDFVFSPEETEVMLEDVRQLARLPRTGFVVGALTPDGEVDSGFLKRLLDVCGDVGGDGPVTFHRAFDACADLPVALETLSGLGVDRVLTSGGAATALEGAPMLKALVQQAAGRIGILAGGGVRPANVAELVRITGVREVHCRATRNVLTAARFGNASLGYDEGSRLVTSGAAVMAMRAALNGSA